MKTYQQHEVKVLLNDLKVDLIGRFKDSVGEVRDCYPESVFPSDSRSQDCKNAKMARKVCDDILRVFSGKEKGDVSECRVVPVSNSGGVLIWGKYNGWKGKIVGEAKNGTEPAYVVKIAKDGVNFITATINKTDIEIL